MRKCIKLRNISDLKYLDRNFPAGTFAFVRAICRERAFLQKMVITIDIK